jgi:Tol biopolymer transport system component
MTLIRVLPLALVLAGACSGKGSRPASLSAATVQSATLNDSTVVVRRIAVDSGEFDYSRGGPTRDGRYFSGMDVKTGNLAVREIRTGERRLLTSYGQGRRGGHAVESLISPNGLTLAFVWSDGQAPFGYELRTIGMDGSGERTLVKTPDTEYVEPTDWTPDGGRLLAIMWRNDHSNQIAFISTVDGSVRVLKSSPDWRSPHAPKLSPDGRWVAYDFQRDQENSARDLFILRADGSRETRITTDGLPTSLVGWSPDGLGLYYGVKRNDAITVWYVPVQEGRPAGAPRVIRSDVWGASTIGLAGTSLYYSVRDDKRTVYTVALDLDAGRVLAPPTPIVSGSGVNLPVIWSPDGNHLAFARNLETGGPSRSVIAIRDISTGAERELPLSLENPTLRHWLPDGRAIIALATRRGQYGIYRVDLATSTAEFVEQVTALSAIPIPSPDGTTEYFVRWRSNDSGAVVARSVQGHQEREIYRGRGNGAASFRLSPDGQSLALITLELRESDAKVAEKLVVIPVAGGEPRVVFSLDPPGRMSSLNWSSDSRHIVFRAGPAEPEVNAVNELWMATLRAGNAHKLLSVPTPFIQPVLSPDGRRVVYVSSTGGESNELWVMENLPGSAKKSPSGAR